MQLGTKDGVLYLDNGWQTLATELRRIATEAQARILTNQSIHHVTPAGDGWLVSSGSCSCQAEAVILAVAPGTAAALVKGSAGGTIAAWAKNLIPVEAACLDIGLKRVPCPEHRFALGVDLPFYFSMHSAWAKLAPEGGALIHAAKYLDPAKRNDAKTVEQELNEWVESIQPGWRNDMVVRRYLPKVPVYHALVTASAGGLSGRPGPDVPGADGLFLAGDWVGDEGLLVDASLLSAKRAAELTLRRLLRGAELQAASGD